MPPPRPRSHRSCPEPEVVVHAQSPKSSFTRGHLQLPKVERNCTVPRAARTDASRVLQVVELAAAELAK
eukprot:2423515-Heterocapsa_arctica.AAC.1